MSRAVTQRADGERQATNPISVPMTSPPMASKNVASVERSQQFLCWPWRPPMIAIGGGRTLPAGTGRAGLPDGQNDDEYERSAGP